MPCNFENELRTQAQLLVRELADAGIQAEIAADSFRDYSVKISVSRESQPLGFVNLYYSPQKNRFSIRTHELRDEAAAQQVEACWGHLLTGKAATANRPDQAAGYEAYTDGSCIGDGIGYGVVILKDGERIAELSGTVSAPELQGMRQVGGELQAVYRALEWCRENGVDAVTIFYDYEGVEKWATGVWKPNTRATQSYANFAQNCPIAVRWEKVRGHSGNPWNSRADQLAKQALSKDPVAEIQREHPLDVARAKALAFAEFLASEGVDASFVSIVNEQCARVEIRPQKGFVDIYNTKRRPLSRPYLCGFRDDSLRARTEALWNKFLRQEGAQVQAREQFPRAVAHYYEILSPYRDCQFDFIDLALALHEACAQHGIEVDVEEIRYDFQALEHYYTQLKGRFQ